MQTANTTKYPKMRFLAVGLVFDLYILISFCYVNGIKKRLRYQFTSDFAVSERDV